MDEVIDDYDEDVVFEVHFRSVNVAKVTSWIITHLCLL